MGHWRLDRLVEALPLPIGTFLKQGLVGRKTRAPNAACRQFAQHQEIPLSR
jgi:hypothetical protein